MENASYYEQLLNDRYKDISTISTTLILIGAVVGVIGNVAIIFIYWFRIKERGERYFLPLLATVDLAACFTNPCFYIMDNSYFYTYPNDAICRILSFLQMCVPGMSAHVLLVISVQRYRLVCKPHSPRMSPKCKRISFSAACIFAFLYSCPLFWISGVEEAKQIFMNHTVRTRICRFSLYDSSMSNIYFGLLALILIGNLIATISLFVPIMRKIKIVLSGFRVKTPQKAYEHSQTSGITSSTEIEAKTNEDHDQATTNSDLSNKPTEIISSDTQKTEVSIKDVELNIIDKKFDSREKQNNKPVESKQKSQESGQGPVKRRITIMFFVIILVYVLSYIPSLAILILTYAIGEFSFIKLTRSETAAWIFLARFVFLNHIANPFICVYFDIKFKNELSSFLRAIFQRCKNRT